MRQYSCSFQIFYLYYYYYYGTWFGKYSGRDQQCVDLFKFYNNFK